MTAATAGWSAGRRAGSGAFIGEMGGSGGLQGPALCVVRRLRAVEAGAGEGSKAEQGPAEEVQRLQAQLCERCVALLVAEKAVCSRKGYGNDAHVVEIRGTHCQHTRDTTSSTTVTHCRVCAV